MRLKVKRTIKLIRCWNQLDKFRVLKRQQNTKVQLVLRHNQQYRQLLRAACWGEMKLQLRRDRYQAIKDVLVNEIDPDIERLHGDIRAIVYQSSRKKRQRVMHMIMLWTVGKVYVCFHQWKKYAQVHTKLVMENTKRRILNLHRSRQLDALTKWAHVIAYDKKMKKKAINEQIFRERALMEDELNSTRVAIESYQLRCQNRGRRLAGKIINAWAMARVQYRFKMWHAILRARDYKLERLDFVAVTKRNRRIVRLYFYKFVKQCEMKRTDDNAAARGDCYAEMLRYRAMKRMFLAMKKFQKDYHMAKANLRKRLVIMDLKTKKSFFLCWKQECDRDCHGDRVEGQCNRVKKVQESVVRSGNLQSTTHE